MGFRFAINRQKAIATEITGFIYLKMGCGDGRPELPNRYGHDIGKCDVRLAVTESKPHEKRLSSMLLKLGETIPTGKQCWSAEKSKRTRANQIMSFDQSKENV